jgi:L-lactate dehydrogenase (cytochrome)
LPRFLFDYADGGAMSETTMRRNRAELSAIELRQRVLCNVGEIDTSTTLFGRKLPLPVALGPVGISGMFRRRGEVQAARAAHARGLPFTLSTVGVCPLQELKAKAPKGPLWFQLYVIRDRGFMKALLEAAKANGVEALVFTVDMPVPGIRYRDANSGLSGSLGPLRRVMQALLKPSWAWDVGVCGRPHQLGNLAPILGSRSGMSDYMSWLAANFDPSIQWRDLDWLRAAWHGPLIIKGVLDVEDARRAVDYGAEGLVVSNHGGRQLDGAMSTTRALPAIADAVGDRIAVLTDSGVRSGLDVARMLTLGARAVLLGRAWLYALAAEGQAGVARMLECVESEVRVAMALTGASTIADLNRSVLVDRWTKSAHIEGKL